VDKTVVEPDPVEPALPVAPAPVEVVEEPPALPVQEDGSTVTVPPREEEPAEPTAPPGEPTEPTTEPGDGSSGETTPTTAPPAGEPGGTSDPPPPPPPPPPAP
jgi:hypothetical protein